MIKWEYVEKLQIILYITIIIMATNAWDTGLDKPEAIILEEAEGIILEGSSFVEKTTQEVQFVTAEIMDPFDIEQKMDGDLCPTVQKYPIDLVKLGISSGQSLSSDWMVRHNVASLIKELTQMSSVDISRNFWLEASSKDVAINNLYSGFLTQLNQLTESLDWYVREQWIVDWEWVMSLLWGELSQKITNVELMISSIKDWTNIKLAGNIASKTSRVRKLFSFLNFRNMKSVWKWLQAGLEWDINKLITLQDKRWDIGDIVGKFENFGEEVKEPFAYLIRTEAMLLWFEQYLTWDLKTAINSSTELDDNIKKILIEEVDSKFVPHVRHYIWLCDLSVKNIVALVKEAKENSKRLALWYERSVFTLNLAILTTWSASQVNKAIELTKKLWEIEADAQNWIKKWLDIVLQWWLDIEQLRAKQIEWLKTLIIGVDKSIEVHAQELLKIWNEIKKNGADLSKMIESGHQKDLWTSNLRLLTRKLKITN
ncbi:MAG: hypothetical protein ACD_49C00009G0002 [uncultured bacterium (gcode 4)]|uniref:Uncharacterized protein n=1 Tax=uncultured bacterium (gcode 4) TaxID=1234023 RepID=K2AYG2_9BACT|nr:MAG: hypothetical protein ACD_49C00009G0002 [uncultured bacterium (gcode 4)]